MGDAPETIHLRLHRLLQPRPHGHQDGHSHPVLADGRRAPFPPLRLPRHHGRRRHCRRCVDLSQHLPMSARRRGIHRRRRHLHRHCHALPRLGADQHPHRFGHSPSPPPDPHLSPHGVQAEGHTRRDIHRRRVRHHRRRRPYRLPPNRSEGRASCGSDGQCDRHQPSRQFHLRREFLSHVVRRGGVRGHRLLLRARPQAASHADHAGASPWA
jgi:hypothetical protein